MGKFMKVALKNFNISDLRIDDEYRRALSLIKVAGARSNKQLGLMDAKKAKAIEKMAYEFGNGKYDDVWKRVDAFQAGGGTVYNMICNELIAEHASKVLGSAGSVHPNNDVNMGQSSNDVTPTAIKVAALTMLKPLLIEVDKCSKAFGEKADKFKNILKVGRTHLQDAVPMTLGQEFSAYRDLLKRNVKNIKDGFSDLQELSLGGNALGTGINTPKEFRKMIVGKLAKLSGLPLRATANTFELGSSCHEFSKASGALEILADDLIKICNDLRLLTSGPNAGLAEIKMMEVEPGSSIMPGKVNPSICECMTMICFAVNGNNLVVKQVAQGGQLQLNTFMPIVAYKLLESISILTRGLLMLREKCVVGIEANNVMIGEHLAKSFVTATALSPYLGYDMTSKLVHESVKSGKRFVELVAEKKIMNSEDLREILSVRGLVGPRAVNKKLTKKRLAN